MQFFDFFFKGVASSNPITIFFYAWPDGEVALFRGNYFFSGREFKSQRNQFFIDWKSIASSGFEHAPYDMLPYVGLHPNH